MVRLWRHARTLINISEISQDNELGLSFGQRKASTSLVILPTDLLFKFVHHLQSKLGFQTQLGQVSEKVQNWCLE
jgi:hypothetical protein